MTFDGKPLDGVFVMHRRLEWAEKVGMAFDLPAQPVGLRGLLIQFPKVG